ncbi:hypothetical protein ACHAW5_003352 [Stephanodiscus triporus]|uniref:Uncharacterized protein n=1 Tax=Stephanodiscus triporus TaxID=2934178 RepID=A0ABD3MYB5_9STRA
MEINNNNGRRGVETTPLLLESLSPPVDDASPLSRYCAETSTSNRRDGDRRGRRFEYGRRVQPLISSPPSHYSSRQFSSSTTSSRKSNTSSYSPRQLSSTTTSSSRQLNTSYPRRSFSSSSPSSNSTIPTASQIWQAAVSLPYRMLCFASPTCSPLCGVCCCFTCIRASEYGVIQRFGKFDRFLLPGMHFVKWPMER